MAHVFTCETYRIPVDSDSKRCVNLKEDGKYCSLGRGKKCTEWLKANGKNWLTTPKVERPDAEAVSSPVGIASPSLPKSSPKPEPLGHIDPVAELPLPRYLSEDDVQSFKDLGVEVCIDTESAGELWIVNQYSQDDDRQELSAEHLATISALCAVFGGARVTAFKKLPPD